METHQVRYFLAVARTLNFTRAAEECNVTQPSLTRAIKKLEEELGGALFHRERANTHLTELGRAMLPHIEQSYLAAQSARALAEAFKRGDVAPLRLGFTNSVSNRLFTDC
jgi:DNA-binding transcriptional LysR family regulator